MAVHINNCFTNESVFKISNNINEDEVPLLSYDYKIKKWLVGRYIGKLFFTYNKKEYCFEVKPRFGNAAILHLLEEVFKIKLASNRADNSLKQNNHNQLIKKLIGLIWVKELSKANVHGLPKNKVKNTYVGNTIKGKIDIRKSIIPLYNQNCIVSNKIEKTTDVVIQSILLKSYQILCKDYFLTQNMLTENVKDVLKTTNQTNIKNITTSEYKKIRYGAMYVGYKSIVDFSWEIIQRKKNALIQKNANKNTDALFLDMAEIWENYLITVFKNKYQTQGWKVYSKKYYAYQNQSFKRGLIPDIILEKDDEVIVWDAKYKNMEFKKYDYDRSDFFQIHTYGSFMESLNKKVLGIGLLYPFKNEISKQQMVNNFSETLFDAGNNSTWFKVDGIALPDKFDELIINKNNFIQRIDEFMIAKNNMLISR